MARNKVDCITISISTKVDGGERASVYFHRGNRCRRYDVGSRSSIRRCHRAQLKLMKKKDTIDVGVLESLVDKYIAQLASYESKDIQTIQRIMHVKDDQLYPFLDWLKSLQGGQR